MEDKSLHGMYHRNTEVADLKKSYQWLERAGLKDSTEALILAAQEQALSTRTIEAQIYHTRQDPRCRLCKEAPEMVQHITAGCKMLERNNQVAVIVYRNICAEYGLDAPSQGLIESRAAAGGGGVAADEGSGTEDRSLYNMVNMSLVQAGVLLLFWSSAAAQATGFSSQPSVSWFPSSLEHTIEVLKSQGSFGLTSSVSLLDSQTNYICNVSLGSDWRAASVLVKDIALQEMLRHNKGVYSCPQTSDRESAAVLVQVKRPHFAGMVTSVVLNVLGAPFFCFMGIFLVFMCLGK
ncbi:hypothetical protein WMY93_031734 [Mugilogobius chulae]|uniref:Ig-like domain-containing protein n=1 Tax=Mugilogobius chulae TaxID=88201 RepID=A0AAW0MGX3_9GOBI